MNRLEFERDRVKGRCVQYIDFVAELCLFWRNCGVTFLDTLGSSDML